MQCLRPAPTPTRPSSCAPAVAPAASTAAHSGPRRQTAPNTLQTPSQGVPYPDSRGRRQAVPVAEPEWSAAYRGLCAHVARLLQPAWELPLVERAGSGGGAPLRSRIPADALQVPRPPTLPLRPLSRQLTGAAGGARGPPATTPRVCLPSSRAARQIAQRGASDPIMPSWRPGCRVRTLAEVEVLSCRIDWG